MSASGELRPLRIVGLGVTYVDEDDVLWTVTERDADGVPGSRGPRCLIFASSEAFRRVWRYPAGWRDLLTANLIALSWSR
jgi:hypothetical protein